MCVTLIVYDHSFLTIHDSGQNWINHDREGWSNGQELSRPKTVMSERSRYGDDTGTFIVTCIQRKINYFFIEYVKKNNMQP